MSHGQNTRLTQAARVTRLAPSPTGALHLGNARSFVLNWAIARAEGMRVVLRIEDLDGPRIRPGADTQAIEDLRWLGLDWDVGPSWQLHNLSPYREALQRLAGAGAVYPCVCTRKELEQAQSAPHAGEHELRYPGTCRPRSVVAARYSDDNSGTDVAAAAWRFRVPDVEVTFVDRVAGPQHINVQQQVGDFVVATKAGLPAYQLAVVIDDARAGVTDVVRGDDLLGSAARQTLLYEALSLGAPPTYWHLPLVVGPDGRRLAKRHGDTRLSWYREQGVDARRVVGLIAFWSGLTKERMPLSAMELLSQWRIDRLQKDRVTFTQEDHAWLLSN
jgi:glutamyl-tRNA synthetase